MELVEFKKELFEFVDVFVQQSNSIEKELECTELMGQTACKGYSFKAYKNIWFRIINMKKIYRIELNNAHGLFDNLLLCGEYKFTKTKDLFIRVELEKDKNQLFALLMFLKTDLVRVYMYLCDNEPVESFGCCSHYLECSDNKSCVQRDPKFAKGCTYRRNLLKGKIFYGNNRNV